MDAVHGGTGAHDRIKAEDELLWMFFGQAMHQVYFGSDRPLTPGRGFLNLLNNILGRAVEISGFYDLAAALGMDQYFDAGIFRAGFGDLLHIEAHMGGAVTFPQNDL